MFDLFEDDLGVSIESFPEGKDMGTGLFKNGFFRKTVTNVGTFTYKVSDAPVDLGLSKECEFNFEFSKTLPKIPLAVFEEIKRFFKEVYKLYKSEVYCSIVWDRECNDYFIHIPEQVVSGAQVNYENELQNPNYIEVAQYHSHSDFAAFFSSGDDKDEVAGKLFGVIGMNHTDSPTNVLRAGFNRQTKSLSLEDVFDTSKIDTSEYTIDLEDALNNITERKDTFTVSSSHSGSYMSNKEFDNLFKQINGYEIEDIDYWDKRLKEVSTDNVLKDTVFETNSRDNLLSLFVYDFKTLFNKNGVYKPQNVLNLYNSLSNLVYNHTGCVDITDDILVEVEATSMLYSIEDVV